MAVERVAGAAAMTVDLLLDAAANLIDRVAAELDDMERVQDGDGVLELIVESVRSRGTDPSSRPRYQRGTPRYAP
jgi:hypothetical protein